MEVQALLRERTALLHQYQSRLAAPPRAGAVAATHPTRGRSAADILASVAANDAAGLTASLARGGDDAAAPDSAAAGGASAVGGRTRAALVRAHLA